MARLYVYARTYRIPSRTSLLICLTYAIITMPIVMVISESEEANG